MGKINSIQTETPDSGSTVVGSMGDGTTATFLVSDIAIGTKKVYKALLTQTGTSAPTAVVLENTIGDIVWTRSNTGQYIGTLAGAFTSNKTIVNLVSTVPAILFGATSISENTVNIGTSVPTSPFPATDSQLTKTPIIIEVYQ